MWLVSMSICSETDSDPENWSELSDLSSQGGLS